MMMETGQESAAWDQVFGTISFDANRPRHTCLAEGLSHWIDQGKLPAGIRLPSTRQIAQRFGMGRNTVLFALNCLVENGYLESRERSGMFIGMRRSGRKPLADTSAKPDAIPGWVTRLGVAERPHRSNQNQSLASPQLSFRLGAFDAAMFPRNHWRECERSANGLTEISSWGRDLIDGDDRGLIEQIRKSILPKAGIWAQPENIMITIGSQEGRFLVAQLLARGGATVGVEDPCSLELVRTLNLCGVKPVSLAVDGEGVSLSDELGRCDVAFVTPAHQNPTTVRMSPQRRRLLLDHIERRGSLLVEDTFDTEMLYESGAVSALKSEDHADRVIYIASLSRHMAPGLRMGFIVAPGQIIEHLRMLRRLIHRHPPANNQRSLAIFIERGYYRRFVRQAGQVLDTRSAVLRSEAARLLPDFDFRFQEGASCFWVTMPTSIDSDAFARAALEQGVVLDHASLFSDAAGVSRHCVRLSVLGLNESEIRKGVALLAEARNHLKESRQERTLQ